jgi:hypothetical protein
MDIGRFGFCLLGFIGDVLTTSLPPLAEDRARVALVRIGDPVLCYPAPLLYGGGGGGLA